jgi:hypothetical protein
MVLGAPPLAEGSLESGGRDVKWVPQHRFEIQSPLSPTAAIEALKAHVEPRRMFRVGFPSSANDKRFQGEVGADGFSITRVIGYRNSFLPQVTGKVRAAGSRSVVDVEMRLFAPVIVLVIAIMAMMLLIVGAVAFEGDVVGLASLVLMPALAYGAVLWAFWFEAEKQDRALREIFNGT